MARIKKVLQHDETDCDAACISIILQYYGKSVPLRPIRSAAGTDSVGTSGYGIVKGAEKFGLSCKGLMSSEKDKIHDIPLPFDDKYDVKCSDIEENIDINTLKGISNKNDAKKPMF